MATMNPALSGAPTATYAPPKLDEEECDEESAKKDFNYSLCESIDYQQPIAAEPTPVPETEKVEAALPGSVTFTKEQFEALLKVAPQLSSLGV